MARKRRPAARRPMRDAPRRGATTGTPRPRRRPAWSLGRVRPRLARLPRFAWALIGLVLFLCVNYAVQVARKPTELLGLVFSPAPLTPAETWARYSADAREHATDVVRAELLAALIQVESSGDPLARTYWRWTWTWDPFRMYAPASTAVGLLQMTDANYEVARHYCVRHHRVLRDDGPVWERCWWSGLQFRTVPRHAIEMTAALLHVEVTEALGRQRPAAVSVAQRDAVAATAHLCGAARAAALVQNGFRPRGRERCGDHELRGYLERVRALTASFELRPGPAARASDGGPNPSVGSEGQKTNSSPCARNAVNAAR